MAEKQKQNQDEQKKVNTSKSIREAQSVTAAQLDQEMKRAERVLKDEKKIPVTIPKYLEKRLGKNVPVAINGAVIHVPVGKKVEIPESMAKVLEHSLDELKL